MNKTSASEWLIKAWHHYSSAKLLFDAHHYTDTIAIDLHYSIEILMKSFLAYENKKIIKSHNLVELSELVNDNISFDDDELDLLDIATKYHIESSYPTPHRSLPTREEIAEVLAFTQNLFDKVCEILEINKNEVMQ